MERRLLRTDPLFAPVPVEMSQRPDGGRSTGTLLPDTERKWYDRKAHAQDTIRTPLHVYNQPTSSR